MTCDARIRMMRPVSEAELLCELDGYHLEHSAVLHDYAYPGSQTKVNWMDDDRRTFHGEWSGDCQSGLGCILPRNHRGGCVQ